VEKEKNEKRRRQRKGGDWAGKNSSDASLRKLRGGECVTEGPVAKRNAMTTQRKSDLQGEKGDLRGREKEKGRGRRVTRKSLKAGNVFTQGLLKKQANN